MLNPMFARREFTISVDSGRQAVSANLAWKPRPKKSGRRKRARYATMATTLANARPSVLVQTRQNRSAFRPDGVQRVRIKPEYLQNRRSDLRGLHKAVDGPRADAGV